MPNGTVTTQDIARSLGISRSTVSRALNNSPLVNVKTRERIFQAARRLGFRANRAARSLVMQKRYRIGVVVFSEPSSFWDEVKHGVRRADEELRDYGVSIDVREPDIRDPDAQARILRELANTGIDAIAVAPNAPKRLTEAIDELVCGGVPVVTFSADVPGSRRLCYLGCDYHRAGRIAGEIMAKFIGGRGLVASLTFADAVTAIAERLDGFCAMFEERPETRLLSPLRCARTGGDVLDATRELCRRHPDIAGLFVTYGVLETAAKAIEDAGLADQVTVVGYDLSPFTASLIRGGTVDAVICQEPFNQGYFPVKILYDYLCENKKPFRDSIPTKLEIVTRENLTYYETEADYYTFLSHLVGIGSHDRGS